MAILDRTLERAQPRVAPALHLGPVLAIAVAAIVIIALLRVVQTSDATTTSFSIQRLEQEKLELEASVSQLEAEVAALSSLARVQQEARRLGLEPPKQRETVQVNVAGPGDDARRLPTRFAPDGEGDKAGPGSPWWRDLLRFLPFY